MRPSWKRLSQKVLLQHPRLTVYEDQVLLPNGIKTDYLHFGHVNDAAMVIGINDDGKILVQKEYSYPPDEWLFQFPGGGIHPGETPKDAALREFAEEANMTGTLREIGWFWLDNRRRADKFYVFVASDLSEKVADGDPEEIIETHWMTSDEIESGIQKGEIVNYTLLAGWSLFKANGLTEVR